MRSSYTAPESCHGDLSPLVTTEVEIMATFPDSKVHGANMGLTWVLSAPDGPHVDLMNFTIWVNIDESF